MGEGQLLAEWWCTHDRRLNSVHQEADDFLAVFGSGSEQRSWRRPRAYSRRIADDKDLSVIAVRLGPKANLAMYVNQVTALWKMWAIQDVAQSNPGTTVESAEIIEAIPHAPRPSCGPRLSVANLAGEGA